MSSNSTLKNQSLYWLSLQHFVSHDVANSKITTLLNEIELNVNNALESSDFDGLSEESYCYYMGEPLHVEYLIKRFCSIDPAYVKKMWNILRAQQRPIESTIQFVKELARNDRLNYTVMAIPHLRESWPIISSQNDCPEILQLFTIESTLRLLLSSTTKQFYIKSAYNGNYLCYESEAPSNYYGLRRHSLYSLYGIYHSDTTARAEPSIRVFACSTKNSTWSFSTGSYLSYGRSFSIVNDKYRRITLDKCDRHNEWYVTLEKTVSQFLGTSSDWNLEMNDIFNGSIRLKSQANEGYLRVGHNDSILISVPEGQIDERKNEWTLEESYSLLHLNDAKCRSSTDYEDVTSSMTTTDNEDRTESFNDYTYDDTE